MDIKQAEEKFEKLKAQFATGALSEAEFKAQLEELMHQDERGNWWMIGYETENWYRHDGKDWVRADPPRNFSKLSTHNKVEQKIGTNSFGTKSDSQNFLWRFGKKEVILSLIGLGIYALITFLLESNRSLFKYWFPAHAVSLFFGLVFGPTVGAIVGAGQYIISTISFSRGQGEIFLQILSSVALIAFAIEGATMGFAKTSSTDRPSFKSILRIELFIILANLVRILISINLVSFLRNPPSSDYLLFQILYPLFGNLIIVPISLVVYSFILSRRKVRA